MGNPPTTRVSLLIRLRDSRDVEAWERFVEIYTPLVYRYARRRGLQDADAADLAQEVLRSVAGSIGGLTYDPQQGSFRGWVLTITGRVLGKTLRKKSRQPQGSGDSEELLRLERQPSPSADDEGRWDHDCEKRLLDWATERLRGEFRDTTWRAFCQTAIEGRRPSDVSKTLGVSIAAVYNAKSRVLARLRELIRTVEDD